MYRIDHVTTITTNTFVEILNDYSMIIAIKLSAVYDSSE